jgi:hypothetical protein
MRTATSQGILQIFKILSLDGCPVLTPSDVVSLLKTESLFLQNSAEQNETMEKRNA